MLRSRHYAGVTARQGLGFTTWRAVCRLVQVLEVSSAAGECWPGRCPVGGRSIKGLIERPPMC
jgi:hypothetical protein